MLGNNATLYTLQIKEHVFGMNVFVFRLKLNFIVLIMFL